MEDRYTSQTVKEFQSNVNMLLSSPFLCDRCYIYHLPSHSRTFGLQMSISLLLELPLVKQAITGRSLVSSQYLQSQVSEWNVCGSYYVSSCLFGSSSVSALPLLKWPNSTAASICGVALVSSSSCYQTPFRFLPISPGGILHSAHLKTTPQ